MDEDWNLPTIPGLSRLSQGLNIYETENTFVAEAALPGIPESNIDVTVDDGIVRITGSVIDSEEDKDQKRYFMRSMTSSFNYSFKLPEGIVADKEPTAEVENGVLILTFSKTEKAPPKKVAIKKRTKTAAIS